MLRNYKSSLKQKGFSIAFKCATSDGTCFAKGEPDAGYYLGSGVGDPLTLPKLADDYVQNWFQEGGRYLLGRLDRPEGAVYAALYLGQSNSGNVAVVRVVETTEMETGKIAFLNASQMEQAIADTGRVALYGILFDFDKDTLKPESEPTLDEIATLLAAKPELKLKIVGHTDNQGMPDYNMDLSLRRAANVVAALTGGYGIDAGRLSAEGAGTHSADRAKRHGRGAGEEPARRAHRAVTGKRLPAGSCARSPVTTITSCPLDNQG